MKSYDVLIIGAGPGGYIAAEEAASLGNSVAVIEKNAIGGCCLNVGCIPSKVYLQYSHWLSTIETANRHGLTITVNDIDFPSIVRRKNEVISTLQKGIHSSFQQKGIDYITGEAVYVENKTFQVNQQFCYGKKVLLATGSSPFIPNINGLSDVNFLTTDTLFNMTTLPKQLVTIGGGVIGVELAFAFNSLGVSVTIIEAADDILLTVDEEARTLVKQNLLRKGIKTITKASIQQVTQHHVIVNNQKISFDALLVATGRQPNVTLPLAMKLQLHDKQNFVKVNDYYETSMKDVYAIGDVIGGYTLAHAASAEGIKAARIMSGKKERKLSSYQIPRPLFVEPEVSEFGMSEEDAKKAGYDVLVERMPFSFNGRAIANGETDGFVKIISESKYHEILGAVVVGANAADLLHSILGVYESEGTIDELMSTVFAHPTVSELIQETAKRIK